VNEAKKSDTEFKARDSYLETVVPDRIFRKTDATTGAETTYLRVMVDKENPAPLSVSYFVDGQPASPEHLADIKAWEIHREHTVHTQESVGVEKQDTVIPLNIKLSNVRSVEIGGEQYVIAE